MQSVKELSALAADNLDAKDWYSVAQNEISTICELEQWDAKRFVGVLATTSPRVACRRNIRVTLQYVGTGEFLANTMRKIQKSVKHFEECGEILGPKTSAFAAALNGDPHAVVLDVHMANLLGVDQRTAFRRKKEIAHWTHIIRVVGARLGIEARAAQACLWFGHKRNVGENPEAFPIVSEYRHWVNRGRSFPRSGYIDGDIGASEQRAADDNF